MIKRRVIVMPQLPGRRPEHQGAPGQPVPIRLAPFFYSYVFGSCSRTAEEGVPSAMAAFPPGASIRVGVRSPKTPSRR